MRRVKAVQKKWMPWLMVLSGMMVTGVSYGVVLNCFGLFVRPVSEAMGFSRQGYGVSMTLVYVFYMVSSMISGRLMEKVSLKRLMRIAAVALPAAYLCNAFSRELWQFYLAAAVQGLCVPFLSFISFAVIIPGWFRQKSGLAIGLTFMGSGVGGMLFNALAGEWVVTLGPTQTFRLLAAIMATVNIPLVFLVIREAPKDASAEEKQVDTSAAADGVTLREAARRPIFYLLLLFVTLVGFSTTVLNQTVVTRLSDLGFDPTYAARVNAMYMGVLCGGKVFLGYLSDKLGIRKGNMIAMCFVFLGMAGLYLAQYPLMHIAVILGGGLGCAMGSVSYPMLTEYACGRKDYSAIYGVITALSYVGGAVSPTLTNAIYDHTGSYDAALILAISMMALAALAHALVRQIRPKAA